VLFVILIVACFALFVLTFRAPSAPKISRLLFFLAWLGVTAALAFTFMVKVLQYNPNPDKVRLADRLVDGKFINLVALAPGVFDLKNINRIDTDWAEEGKSEKDSEARNEWLAFYRYDIVGTESKVPSGPFGGAIYDSDNCRPPAVQSFELVPVNYDYLGEDDVSVTVENIIAYPDPRSAESGAPPDYPEVVVNGYARSVVTDLNIFRRTGVQVSCPERRQWAATHAGQPVPQSLRYEAVGSFRATYVISRDEATITVIDRAGFERSQFTTRKVYRPLDGSYFKAGTQTLLDPVEYSLGFGPGQPDVPLAAYYPEKAVLAFYLALGKDKKELETAKAFLSVNAQKRYDIKSDAFGLSSESTSTARARDRLARVLVWEIRYVPDAAAEQLHQDRQVGVKVVGVGTDGRIDGTHVCDVTWNVVGVPGQPAAPYGYEWRLDSYQSTCSPTP